MTGSWEIAAHSAYDMFSKYLMVSLVFSHLGFWSGNFFMIVPFPDHCLLVLFRVRCSTVVECLDQHGHLHSLI